MEITYIDNNQALYDACQQFKTCSALCVDTEFHRETTYYPELALVQLSDGELTVCVDPFGIDDFQPMLDLFVDQAIVKVLHASQQDMEIFFHRFNVLPTPVFDTQIAAGLLGYGEQVGYAPMIKQVLDVDIDKSQTRTDWMRRPLNQKQIEYAASDVYYLAQAYRIMHRELDELGRLDWLQDDFAALSRAEQYQPDAQAMWKKVKSHQQLRGNQLAILQSLAAWRENAAQQRDKPRRRVTPDEALIDISKQKPNSVDKIYQLRSLQKFRLAADDAKALLNAMQQGQQRPKEDWPSLPKKYRLSMEQDALVDAMQALIKLMAAEHRINPGLYASRKQLEALLFDDTDIPLLQGWRHAHGGQQVLDFLANRVSLRVESGQLIAEHA